MDAPAYNDWKWVSLSPLPTWALIALGVALALGVVLAALGLRREPSMARRWTLWSLRVLAGLAALFLVLEPGIRQLQTTRVKNRLAILVDRSASMGFPVDAKGRTRSVEVGEYLAKVAPALRALEDRYVVELYGFEPELAPLTAERVAQEPARASRSDLLGALRAARAGAEGASSKALAGVMLFSDGADNAALAHGVRGAPSSVLEDLGVPVSTFLVGRDGTRDIAVERVRVDDFAFVRNSITVEVDLRARGYKGQTVPVVLAREAQTLGNKPLTFDSDDGVQTLSFTFTPDQTGRFVYTLSTPVLADEAVKENNARSFVLKVIRDRIRVLLVVGRPSWDERFLRGLLRQDPNVDLISFYILRAQNQTQANEVPDRDLSLIPFPIDEIFDKKLDTFDVVIFQNFGHTERGLSVALYEDNLVDYVEQGGAFVFIGGDSVLGSGRGTFRTLMRAMPVDETGAAANEERFFARLTEQGARHPVTAVGSARESAQAAWASLPAVPGLNMVRAKPGATVLLEHPALKVDGQPAPLLALWEHGRGRAMALATDGSWHWAFTAHADGSPERHYDRFWGNALRWLVRDPELTTLSVAADPPSVEPGQPVAGVITVRQPDYGPAPGAQVQVELFSVERQAVVGRQAGTTGADGVVRVEFEDPEAGAYKLRAQATKGGVALGEGEDSVAVRAVGPELADTSVRPELLEAIAKLTGGRAFKLPMDSLPQVPLLEPPLVEVGRSQDRPLWDRWYYLVVLVALLGAEWFLRRRFGYV